MSSPANQEKKVAFITGGNKGIGFETGRQLGQLGITVVLGCRDLEQGRQAAEKLRAEGIIAEASRFDITNPQDHEECYGYFDKRYGKLDILVNNAGITNTSDFQIHDSSSVSVEDLHKVFETNFFAVVALTQKLLPLLKRSAAGRIVNLSSILGSLTLHADPNSPIAGSKGLAYNASKTALNAFTIHLAAELKDTNIKVNSAHPGWVKTDMGGSAAPLELEDGAKTSVELATIASDGPTGGYFHMGETLPW